MAPFQFEWKRGIKQYIKMEIESLHKILKHVQNKQLVIYVDRDEDPATQLRKSTMYYKGIKGFRVEDFYKKLNSEIYKNRIYDPDTEYDQGFFSVDKICFNPEAPEELTFGGYVFTERPNTAIKYTGGLGFHSGSCSTVIRDFVDLPKIAIVCRSNSGVALRYPSSFQVYFMENVFVHDETDFCNESIIV